MITAGELPLPEGSISIPWGVIDGNLRAAISSGPSPGGLGCSIGAWPAVGGIESKGRATGGREEAAILGVGTGKGSGRRLPVVEVLISLPIEGRERGVSVSVVSDPVDVFASF